MADDNDLLEEAVKIAVVRAHMRVEYLVEQAEKNNADEAIGKLWKIGGADEDRCAKVFSTLLSDVLPHLTRHIVESIEKIDDEDTDRVTTLASAATIAGMILGRAIEEESVRLLGQSGELTITGTSLVD